MAEMRPCSPRGFSTTTTAASRQYSCVYRTTPHRVPSLDLAQVVTLLTVPSISRLLTFTYSGSIMGGRRTSDR